MWPAGHRLSLGMRWLACRIARRAWSRVQFVVSVSASSRSYFSCFDARAYWRAYFFVISLRVDIDSSVSMIG